MLANQIQVDLVIRERRTKKLGLHIMNSHLKDQGYL
jgi:hypothetical protein